MRHFEARLSPRFRGATLAIAAVLVGLAAWSVATGSTHSAGVLLAILLLMGLLSVRGYTVQPGRLVVHRPGWSTRIDLAGLVEARPAPDALRGAWSLASTRGMFGTVGWVRCRGLGTCRAYVTDPARAVVLRFHGRAPVIVSPRAPGELAAALQGEARPAGLDGGPAARARPPPLPRPAPFTPGPR